MSGLLRRLAGQVVPNGAPRVRAAESLRRAPPIVMPSGSERREAATSLARAPLEATRREQAFTRSLAGVAEPATVAAPAASFEAERPSSRAEDPPWLVPPPLPELAPALELVRVEPRLGDAAMPARYAPEERRESDPGYARHAEPSEVHVHIGRIEVTAVQEPPSRRTKREPQRPSPSLEDYLAGRTRRAP